jgi:diacylglycerol O-acyltransferase / wax synthase
VNRLRPDDDYFLCMHSPATPMQIGALQLFDVLAENRDRFVADVRAHLARRIPATALARVRRSPPFHVDTDAWFTRRTVDLDPLVAVLPADEMSMEALHGHVARWVMEHLDPDLPPFRIVVVPRVEGGRAALFLTVLHALADGVGFQSIVASLTDDTPTPAASAAGAGVDERIPTGPEWLVRSGLALMGDAREGRRRRQSQEDAQAALDAYKREHPRARTPRFELSGATSDSRSYDTVSLPLERFRRIATALHGTVNDVFLAVGSGAVRAHLLSIDALPPDPIVVNAARSYRRPEHGDLGNRIVSLHPHLATDIADPVERFDAIRASMAAEVARSRLQEPLMDQRAVPFGARRLRAQMTARVEGGGAVLPGNVSLSNVPGPAAPRYLAGYRMLASYPAPIIGAGRFLNVTLRRYVDHLDLGIMTDATKISEAATIRRQIERALGDLEVAAGVPI